MSGSSQQQQPESWEWHGWGTSLCWFANAIGDDADKTSTVCQLLFDELGLSIARYNIGGSRGDEGGYRTGGAVPCCKASPAASGIDLSIDERQLAVLRAARKVAGGDRLRVEAFVNSPPYYWTASGSSKGHHRPLRDNLRREHVADFAAFTADVLDALAAREGIACAAVTPFNEPLSPMWVNTPGNQQEGCYVSLRTADAVSHELGTVMAHRLQQRGTVLSGHEENNVFDALLRWVFSRRRPQRVALHTYTLRNFRPHSFLARVAAAWQDNDLWRRALRRLTRGRELVVSEYAQSGHAGFAQHVLRDLRTLRPSAWMYWQAVEDEGSDWGLLHTALSGNNPAVTRDPKFHLLRIFVSHLRPGMRMFVPADSNAIAACDPDTRRLTKVLLTTKHAKTVAGPCSLTVCSLETPGDGTSTLRIADGDIASLPLHSLVGIVYADVGRLNSLQKNSWNRA